MLSIFKISFLFLCICNVLFLSESSVCNEPITVRPYISEMPNKPSEAMEQNTPSTQPLHYWSKEEIEEMETVFESSPEKAQFIVNRLQNPDRFGSKVCHRAAFFTGEPGTGKTVMAKAIAYKMAQKGWKYKFIPSPGLLRKNRNSTAENIVNELEKIEASNEPTILVIDELNKLLENSNHKSYDTDFNGAALWTFLDKHMRNNNFFLIGTMNRTDKLPQPVKDRMTKGFISFPLITDPKIKNTFFRKNFISMDVCLDKEVTDDFLNKELEKIGPCSGRNIKLLSETIVMNEEEKQEETLLPIKRESISQAINEYLQIKTSTKHGEIEETDEERQDRYHNMNKDLQTASLMIQAFQIAPKIAENVAKILVTIFF